MTKKEDFRTLLKVKIKSLAAEARIIRKEELNKRNSHVREHLYLHRIHEVRDEARAAQIAYAFIRGKSYSAVEGNTKKQIPLKRVTRLVMKYDTKCGYAYLGFHKDSEKESKIIEKLNNWFKNE